MPARAGEGHRAAASWPAQTWFLEGPGASGTGGAAAPGRRHATARGWERVCPARLQGLAQPGPAGEEDSGRAVVVGVLISFNCVGALTRGFGAPVCTSVASTAVVPKEVALVVLCQQILAPGPRLCGESALAEGCYFKHQHHP